MTTGTCWKGDISTCIWKKEILKSVLICDFSVNLKMDNQRQHFQHILLFCFKKSKNAVQVQTKVCVVYGVDAINKRTCQKRISNLRSENFDVDDVTRSGRPVEADSEKIKAIIQNKRHKSKEEIAKMLQMSKMAVENHLYALSYSNRLNV